MFLSILTAEQKQYFLELAHLAMNIDGHACENEKAALQNFKLECELIDYQLQNKSLEEVLEFFQDERPAAQKSVLIELFGLLFADGDICDAEEKLIMQIAEAWNLSLAQLRRLRRWVQDFNDVIADGYSLIGSK